MTPFIALGHALQSAGHHVVLVVLDPWRELVATAGLPCLPIPLGDEALWPCSPALRRAMIAQPGLMWAGMRHHTSRSAATIAEAMRIAAHGADVIVSGVLTAKAAARLADHLDVPAATLLLAPLLPSNSAASAVLAPPHLPGVLTTTISTGLWHMTLAMGDAIRSRTDDILGAHRQPTHRQTTPSLTMVAASPVISPPSIRHSSTVHQTGWFSPHQEPQPLSPQLETWLQNHPTAVLMDFGSIPVARRHHDMELMRRAAHLARRPLVVQNPDLPSGEHSDRLWNAPGADHRTLIPLVDLVVHHGGAGTTYTTLAAARPAVVVPHLGDQLYYARRVRELGIGTSPGPRWRVRPHTLAEAMATADDNSTRRRCRELGSLVAAEDGASVAARIVADLAQGKALQG